ncbi:MAG: hypothetical protein QW367_02105 [Candidatus Aenigmatarchaeota archaeon]
MGVKKIAKFKLIGLFLLLFLIFSLSLIFAEEKKEVINVTEIIEIIIAILPIIFVILILLYLGDFLKFGKVGIPWPIIIYSAIIIIIFILPILQKFGIIHIFPDNPDEIFSREEFKGYKQYKLPEGVCRIFLSLNISESVSCYMPAFIYFFLLPFVAIYAITWASLKQIKIFEGLGRNLEGLFAFIIAFMTLPMGTFILLVAFWFSVMGAFSIAIFVAMFLAGVFFRGLGFVEEKRFEYIGKRARDEYLRKVHNAARLAIDRINIASDVDEIIRAVYQFIEKTGHYVDFSKIDEIRKKSNLEDAKKTATSLIEELASKTG